MSMGKGSPAAKKYFWNTDFDALDIDKHKQYVLERILEFGDDAAVEWMRENYAKEDIIEAFEHSTRISPKSRNYWNLVLHK